MTGGNSDYVDLQNPPDAYGDAGGATDGYGPRQNAPSPYGQAVLAVADAGDAGSGSGGGGGTSSSVQLPSPYPSPSDPGLTDPLKSDKLRQSFTDLTKKKAFAHLKLALVDLTGVGQGAAPYVGFKDRDLSFVGSIAKIALILPAFALRQAARSAAALLVPPPSPGDFFNLLESAWDNDFRRGFRGGKANDSKPNLKAILAAKPASKKSATLNVDFTMQQDQDIKKSGFRPRLVLALDLSVNAAAALCINDLGFPFIHEAHRAAGLDKDGLRLNLNFGGKFWDPSMSESQNATARWIAELLVLIARDRLVANGLATEIHDMMETDFPDLVTGIDNLLPDAERATLSRQGKIGYLDDGPFADCSIIRRTTAKGTMLCYVAVALGGKSHDEIKDVGAALDDCILVAHGEPPKPAAAP